jgi:hypothetical protein
MISFPGKFCLKELKFLLLFSYKKIVETTEIKVILRLKIISEKIENYEEKVWYFY